jgi:hypothetical protein
MFASIASFLTQTIRDKKNNIAVPKIPLALVGVGIFAYIIYSGFSWQPPGLNNILTFLLILVGSSALFYSTGPFFKISALVCVIGLFLSPLAWNWRGLAFDEKLFMGIFPLNDGIQYLTDAYRLLSGLDFTYISTRRPIFTGFLAFLLWISGRNFLFTLGVLCVGTAISIYYLARETRDTAGPLSAGVVLTLLFYCYIPYIGRVYSENIGLSLGALGTALLIRGTRTKSLTNLAVGTFALSLGLNARAGAFLILPAIIIWTVILYKKINWKVTCVLTGAILAGFAINYLLVKTIGISHGVPFANFGYTLYGLAAGYKGWAYIYSVHPGVTDAETFSYALELIRQNPFNLLLGILISFKEYLTPETMFQFMYFGPNQILISYILLGLTLMGLFRLWRNRKDSPWLLILILFAGNFLSVSFLPPTDDGVRAMTVTIPIIALVAGFALSQNTPNAIPENIKNRFYMPAIYVLVLAIVFAIGPLEVKALSPSTTPEKISCPENYEPITVYISKGSYINIVDLDTEDKYGFIPNLRRKDIISLFRASTRETFPIFLDLNQEYYTLLRGLASGDTILASLNLQQLGIKGGPPHLIFLVTKTAQIKTFNGLNNFCGSLATNSLKNNYFYFDISMGQK